MNAPIFAETEPVRPVLPVLALVWVAAANAADPGARVEYIGGTVAALANTSGSLDLTDNRVLRFTTSHASLEIPYEQVNLLEYGQKVDRRYGAAIVVSPLFLLSKKRAHFLTIGYTDEQGRQQALVFRVHKRHIRPVLVSLEARTGRRVQYQDEEARKAGKG
jgi:hypothetical protein